MGVHIGLNNINQSTGPPPPPLLSLHTKNTNVKPQITGSVSEQHILTFEDNKFLKRAVKEGDCRSKNITLIDEVHLTPLKNPLLTRS
jgi:hypothetical protein